MREIVVNTKRIYIRDQIESQASTVRPDCHLASSINSLDSEHSTRECGVHNTLALPVEDPASPVRDTDGRGHGSPQLDPDVGTGDASQAGGYPQERRWQDNGRASLDSRFWHGMRGTMLG